ncbi:nucleotidyltransferase domain-containing protein [Candidatus Nitrospira bockiana]
MDSHARSRRLSHSEKERVEQELKAALGKRPEVLFAFLHGSFIQEGTFRDIDLALYIHSERPHISSYREYEVDLGVHLTFQIRIPVDVRVLNDASVAFRYHASKGRVLLVRNADLLDEFRIRTWDEYFDFAPFARRYLWEAMGGEILRGSGVKG